MDKNISQQLQDLKSSLVFDIDITGDIISDISNTEIMVSDLGVPDDTYAGRYLIIANGLNMGTYKIISHTSTTIIINEILQDETQVDMVIERDTELEQSISAAINTVNSSNPYMLTKYDFPNYNSMFTDWDGFTDWMISMKESYKNINSINTYIEQINIFLDIDISVFSNKVEVDNYIIDINQNLNIINNIHIDLIAYFARLKKLLAKMNISDSRVKNNDWEAMYNAKPISSQQEIDSIYQVYVDTDYKEYTINKQTLMFNIKID